MQCGVLWCSMVQCVPNTPAAHLQHTCNSRCNTRSQSHTATPISTACDSRDTATHLQHTCNTPVTHCNTPAAHLQRTCNTSHTCNTPTTHLQHTRNSRSRQSRADDNGLCFTRHCNTPATHCNKPRIHLQRTATRCNTFATHPQHTATHLQHTCNTPATVARDRHVPLH